MPQIKYRCGVRDPAGPVITRPRRESATLNLNDAAAMLGCSTKWLRRQVDDGTVPGRRIGRKYLFSRAALNSWLAGRSGQT